MYTCVGRANRKKLYWKENQNIRDFETCTIICIITLNSPGIRQRLKPKDVILKKLKVHNSITLVYFNFIASYLLIVFNLYNN